MYTNLKNTPPELNDGFDNLIIMGDEPVMVFNKNIDDKFDEIKGLDFSNETKAMLNRATVGLEDAKNQYDSPSKMLGSFVNSFTDTQLSQDTVQNNNPKVSRKILG